MGRLLWVPSRAISRSLSGKMGPVPIFPLRGRGLQHAQKCLNMQQCPSLHELADAGWGVLF